MDDIITIEECVSRLDAIRHEIVSDSRDHFALSAGIAALYEMENGTPAVNRWIPCSERLPEDNQQCLIYRDIKVGKLKMTTGVYFADRQVFIGLQHGTALRDAIAWMPLPEPPESEVQE